MFGALVERGLEVYLIDWGYPDGADRRLGLDDYINRYIDSCVNHICDQHTLTAINLLGICQGGTFSVCYAALYGEKVKNLILTVTPIDFATEHDRLSGLVRHLDIDLLVDTFGNIPGDMLNQLFLSLKPFRLAQQKYVHFAKRLDDKQAVEMFVRMEQWIFDSPALAGEALREFAKDFYQRNALIKGEVRIGERRVSLAEISMPILNIYARDDHLVPAAASKALQHYVGSKDYSSLELPGGHIGVYVGDKARKRIPQAVSAWLGDRQ